MYRKSKEESKAENVLDVARTLFYVDTEMPSSPRQGRWQKRGPCNLIRVHIRYTEETLRIVSLRRQSKVPQAALSKHYFAILHPPCHNVSPATSMPNVFANEACKNE
jgi:hypothetical protein